MNTTEPKILEEGESTYRNGGGSMCGGVISKTLFDSNPMAYMMAYYMDDEDFDLYKRLKSGGSADQKAATDLFNKKAHSAI